MKPRNLFFLLLLAGCAAGEPSRPPLREVLPEPPEATASAGADAQQQRAPEIAAPDDAPMSLAEALQAARAQSIELQAIQNEMRAQIELAEAAGSLPDPTLVTLVEGFPISAPRGSTQLVAGITQPIPLSSRMAGEEALAGGRVRAMIARREVVQSQVDSRLRGAFGTALSLQEATALQSSRLDMAKEAVAMAAARVTAGDTTSDERRTFEVARARLEHEVHELDSRLYVARAELFSLLGMPDNSAKLEADLGEALNLPAIQTLSARIAEVPAVAEAQTAAEVAALRADLADAQTVPMVNLTLFYRRLDINRDGLDFGVSFQLPFSGRAAAQSRAAELQAAAASQRNRLQLRESLLDLKRAHAAVARALDHVLHFENELLPATSQSLAVAEARFAAGDLSKAAILPLRDEAAQVRLASIEAWFELMSAWAQLAPYLP